LAALAVARIRAGDRQEAGELLDEIIALRSVRFVPPEEIARIYAQLGDIDAAMQWLERGYDLRSRGLIFLNLNKSFDPLRSDARFQEIQQKMGLNFD
jgi:tetratricopeptide (TPR) repeat protein